MYRVPFQDFRLNAMNVPSMVKGGAKFLSNNPNMTNMMFNAGRNVLSNSSALPFGNYGNRNDGAEIASNNNINGFGGGFFGGGITSFLLGGLAGYAFSNFSHNGSGGGYAQPAPPPPPPPQGGYPQQPPQNMYPSQMMNQTQQIGFPPKGVYPGQQGMYPQQLMNQPQQTNYSPQNMYQVQPGGYPYPVMQTGYIPQGMYSAKQGGYPSTQQPMYVSPLTTKTAPSTQTSSDSVELTKAKELQGLIPTQPALVYETSNVHTYNGNPVVNSTFPRPLGPVNGYYPYYDTNFLG
ncbi:MAG: hypothetical protein ACRCST_17240 [Turicibacter sp.]